MTENRQRTILVVDDDARLRALVVEYLTSRGLQTKQAPDGESGLREIAEGSIDLVILDVMLPGKDGLEICREIRRTSQVPVIMLTARGDETDRIVGLELGADDYLAKPFNPRELLARIHAVLRRSEVNEAQATRLTVGPIVLDLDRRSVQKGGSAVELTTTEFEILRTLLMGAGRVIPREKLMELARGADFAAFERSVDVHVSHLRKKLGDDPKTPRLIKTVRGVGYTVPKDPESS